MAKESKKYEENFNNLKAIAEELSRQEISIDYLRWFYTALTRATDRLYLVNFQDDWFE